MNKVFKLLNLTTATAIMSFAIVGQSFAASSSFTDLNDAAAKDKIIALQQSGILEGVAPSLFAPFETLTEAQSIQLIVHALGLNLDTVRFVKEPKASDYFTYAKDNAWYAQALITASVNNLDLPKNLDPNKEVTREEFTYQLIHAIESVGRLPLIQPVVVDVKDGDQIHVEYSGSIQRALIYGIVKLSVDGKINPKLAITREQAAEEIYNTVQYLKSHPVSSVSSESITASEGVKLIADTLGLAGTDIKIKIDTEMKMTRESFVSLFMQTLKTSGKLPMINIVPVYIKDIDQVDISNSGSVQLAVTLGFLKLSDEGIFNPKAQLTRADATQISDNISAYLKAHQPQFAAVTYEEGVKMIADALRLAGTDIKIKIDPNAKMTRESFVSLLVQTLQSSEKLPMIKPVSVDIKDLDQIDPLNIGHVQLAVSLGIVHLSKDSLFNPKGELSHADASEIVAQALTAIKAFEK